jgi:hypothetical protein
MLLKQIIKGVLTLCAVPFMFVGMILMLYGWIFLIFKPSQLRKFISFISGGRLANNAGHKANPIYG